MWSVNSCAHSLPPLHAGTNTGDHMYVRASDACNQLAITQPNPNDGQDAMWSIRIDQVSLFGFITLADKVDIF